MIARLRRRFLDPQIGRHLLREEGEVIVEEVPHHRVVYVLPVLIAFGGLVTFVLFLLAPVGIGWLPLLLTAGIWAWAGFRAMRCHLDRFVVTNMRVFRVSGVLNRKLATMPLARILDITVEKPLIGRLLGYGHFTFENAAHAQGLRLIKHVGHPDQLDLTIQRVVQQSGLRAKSSG